jgi:hypothetical protein
MGKMSVGGGGGIKKKKKKDIYIRYGYANVLVTICGFDNFDRCWLCMSVENKGFPGKSDQSRVKSVVVGVVFFVLICFFFVFVYA